jgi:hypothetical protein
MSFDTPLDEVQTPERDFDRVPDRTTQPVQGRDGRPLPPAQPLPKHAHPSYAPEAGPRYTCGACRSPLFRVERTAAERRIENSRRMRCSAAACGWEGLLTSTACTQAALDNRGAAAWGAAPAARVRKRSLLLPLVLGATMLAGVAAAAVLAWQAFGGGAAAAENTSTHTPAGPVAVGVAADGMTLTSPSLGVSSWPAFEAPPAPAGK